MSDWDDDPAQPAESDIRRRAAWLLGMLVLVAALFVTLMVTLLSSSGGDKKNSVADIDGPEQSTTDTGPAPSTTPRTSTTAASTTTPVASTTTPSGSTTPPARPRCPSAATCVISGDIGNAVAAINAYRVKHGLPAVIGAVSPAAQKCAKAGGNGCKGGWAETQLSAADGPLAVKQILQFGKLLDPKMKTISVGWAYNPGQKQYNFALIRNE